MSTVKALGEREIQPSKGRFFRRRTEYRHVAIVGFARIAKNHSSDIVMT
jgi:hypothetical protein